jgi:hypothetical protein
LQTTLINLFESVIFPPDLELVETSIPGTKRYRRNGAAPVVAGAISKCSFSCQVDWAVSRKALPETVSSCRIRGKSTADSGSCKVLNEELGDIIDDAQNLLLSAKLRSAMRNTKRPSPHPWFCQVVVIARPSFRIME